MQISALGAFCYPKNTKVLSAGQNEGQFHPSFGTAGVTQKFYTKGVKSIFKTFNSRAAEAVNDFRNRMNLGGQFLKWVDLPKQQLKRLNYFYETAAEFKKKSGDKPLTVLGIGGSKHTVENLIALMGGDKTKVQTYSGIDNLSFNKFLKEKLGGNVKNSNYMVVSKSGTTFETADGSATIRNLLIKEYQKEGLKEAEAIKKANSHFVAVSDKSTKSTLRVQANENNYMGEFFIHDDVGGRFSIYDDQGMFALAYAGIEKSKTKNMLQGAIKMTEACLNPDISRNPAMKKAVLYADSLQKGHKEQVHQLFGDVFEATPNWEKQLHFESLKDNLYTPGIVPESMHYAAESHYAPANKYHFVITTPKFPKSDDWYNPRRYLQGITNAYKRTAQTLVETIKMTPKSDGLDPQAVGAYCQMEHFNTIYKGRLRAAINKETSPSVYPEVLQPYVETYKNEFKGGVLKPGGIV